MSVNNSCDNAVMYERQRSSAFIQLTPRHESRISDGLSTHQVDVHRSDVRNEEVSDSGRSDARNDIVEFAGPRQTLHLAPDSVGPRVYTEVNRRDAYSAVEYVDPGHILHVALKRGVNNDNDVEQSDIVEFADPQTLQ